MLLTYTDHNIHPITRCALSGGYLAAIAWFSLSTSPSLEGLSPDFPGADKIAHVLMYAGLGAMLRWVCRGAAPGYGITPWILGGATGYGVLMEVLQFLCTDGIRAFEWGDMGANAAGVATAWFVVDTAWRPKESSRRLS